MSADMVTEDENFGVEFELQDGTTSRVGGSPQERWSLDVAENVAAAMRRHGVEIMGRHEPVKRATVIEL
jgi:hypothetical protein